MIPTPYRFEANFSPQEFQKLGQFASRWAHIEHTIGNCLRRVLNMSQEHAAIIIFPLSLELRMQRIGEAIKQSPLSPESTAFYEELRPLVKAMQYLRNTVLHGIVVGEEGEEQVFHLRSKDRNLVSASFAPLPTRPVVATTGQSRLRLPRAPMDRSRAIPAGKRAATATRAARRLSASGRQAPKFDSDPSAKPSR